MKFLNSLLLSSALLTSSIYGDGFGFSVGPFDLQFGIGNSGTVFEAYVPGRNPMLDNPICEAISTQLQLGFTVEGREVVNSKEIKIITKRLVVEPYVFGVTKDGKPVLRGKIISEKLIKEATVKFGEDRFDEPTKDSGWKGWFHSSEQKNIDIRNISDLQVIKGTHFDVPSDYKPLNDENVRVICQIPARLK